MQVGFIYSERRRILFIIKNSLLKYSKVSVIYSERRRKLIRIGRFAFSVSVKFSLYTPRGDENLLALGHNLIILGKVSYILREETETKKAEINYALKLKMSIIRHFFYLHKL